MVRTVLLLLVQMTAFGADPAPVEVEVTASGSSSDPTADRLPVLFDADDEASADQASDDVFLFGRRATIDAPVADNAFLMAQQSEVNQPVSGDVLAMGETVRIEAPVAGDVYALGKTVILTDRASVGGSVFAGGQEVQIDGPVRGDLSIGAGSVVLSAPIGGNANLQVGELELGDGGAIGGDLTYEAPQPAAGIDGVVGGTVKFTQHVEEVDDDDEDVPEAPPSLLSRLTHWSMWTGWSYGSKLLVGFAFLALGGASAGKVARALLAAPGRAIGTGFVVMAVLPPATLVALALVLPIPLGVLGLVAFCVALYAGQILAAQAVGDLILRRMRPDALGQPYISMAVGLIPLVLIASVPWIGTLAWFVATIAGIGALCLAAARIPVQT